MSSSIDSGSKPRFSVPGLDGIRGLSVLALFVYHADIIPHFPGPIATTTFFFLSGFLITTLFIREAAKKGDVDLRAFYMRRALRILPPLYLILALSYLANSALSVGDTLVPWKVWSHFLHYTNYGLAIGGNHFGFLPGMILLWSLAVDEHFYLLIGPFFRFVGNKISANGTRSLATQILVAVNLAVLLWRVWLFRGGAGTLPLAVATDTRIDAILWGAVLALTWNPAVGKPSKFLSSPLTATVAVLGLVAPIALKSDAFRYTFGFTLQSLCLMSIFSFVVTHEHGIWGRILHSRFLLWTSQISYSLYLLSGLTLDTTKHLLHAPKWAVTMVAFSIAYGLASLMFVTLERWLLKVRQRILEPKATGA